ncbi:glycosyltransferase family 2 protein [bacterium]|nr:glycosyltransferase family 2 protein [bacterium]
MKITLVILTLNEYFGLKTLFETIPFASVDEIIAVDGGSSDGTVEFLQTRGVPVYNQTIKGRGEAFRVAFQKARGDALVFFSPDGNEDSGDIPKFRPYLEQGYAMVVATRMVKGAYNEEDDRLFKWRKWANNAFNLMANLTWNRGEFISDTINGFRAITRSAWSELGLDGPGYTIEYQSSIRCFKKGLPIHEFPTREGRRLDEKIGSPSLKTGLAFLRLYVHELIIGRNWTR